MDKFDFMLVFIGVVFVGIVIIGGTQMDKDGKQACQKMIELAQTREDSLSVYAAKPASRYTTCAERLD